MATTPAPEVTALRVRRVGADLARVPEGLRPLAPTAHASERVELRLANVSTAQANALVRAAVGEAPGYALRLEAPEDAGGAAAAGGLAAVRTDDPLLKNMKPFIRSQIEFIPLYAELEADVASRLRFRLRVHNRSPAKVAVTSGAIEVLGSTPKTPPPFAETFQICVLGPGRQLVVDPIVIRELPGSNYAAHARARCAAVRPLDLAWAPGAVPDPACPDLPQAVPALLPSGAPAGLWDQSGWKGEELLQKEARRHSVVFTVPSVLVRSEVGVPARRLLHQLCLGLIERLRAYAERLETGDEDLLTTEGDVVRAKIPRESSTLATVLEGTLRRLDPELGFVGVDDVGHTDHALLTINSQAPDDVPELLADAVRQNIKLFHELAQKISRAKIEVVKK